MREYLNLGVLNKFLHNRNSTQVFEKAQKSESSFSQNKSKQTTDKSYHLGANKQTWSVPQLFMVTKNLFKTATCRGVVVIVVSASTPSSPTTGCLQAFRYSDNIAISITGLLAGMMQELRQRPQQEQHDPAEPAADPHFQRQRQRNNRNTGRGSGANNGNRN